MRPSPALLTACLGLAACAPSGDTGAPTADDTGEAAAPGCEVRPEPAPAGCVVLFYEDEQGDGRQPDLTRSLYDAEARLVARDSRSATDWEEFEVCTYTWREGDQPEQEWCAGRSTYTYTWTYDASGRVTGKVYDAGADGTVDESWTYETDAAGRIVEEAQDEDLDGAPDAFTAYAYDEAGNTLREAWDYDGDGAEDYVRTYAYDEAGRLVTAETDTDGDGATDRRVTHAYDALGQLVRTEEDLDADGSADAWADRTYADCRLSLVETRDADGVMGEQRYTWTGDGRVSGIDEDWNADGHTDARRWYEYHCP